MQAINFHLEILWDAGVGGWLPGNEDLEMLDGVERNYEAIHSQLAECKWPNEGLQQNYPGCCL